MLLQADAALIPLKDNSVHCCVTSPPYWGLRKYAGEQGRGEYPNLGLEPSPEQHVSTIVEIFREVKRVLRDDGVVWLNYGDCYSAAGWESNRRSVVGAGSMNPEERKSGKIPNLAAGNLMLMPHRVAIALQDDGWIVRNDLIWFKRNPMPESCAGWRFERSRTKVGSRGRGGEDWRDNATETPQQRHGPDGSFLQDAIYEYGEDYELHKGSWRHTRAHEYIFMLTKKMQYFCDQEVVRDSIKGISAVVQNSNLFSKEHHFINDRLLQSSTMRAYQFCIDLASTLFNFTERYNDLSLMTLDTQIRQNLSGYFTGFPTIGIPTIHQITTLVDSFSSGNVSPQSFVQELNSLGFYLRDVDGLIKCGAFTPLSLDTRTINSDCNTPIGINDASEIGQNFTHDLDYTTELQPRQTSGRNPRSVLDVPTSPYKGAHYATFPPNLIAPLVRASCPRRACPECGQGWAAVVEKQGGTEGSWHDHQNDQSRGQRGGDHGHNPAAQAWSEGINRNIHGYRPTCECGHDEYVPGITLDPFIGSGTTGAVARELQRRWIGLDISMEYLDEQAKVRALNLTPSNALDELPLFNL